MQNFSTFSIVDPTQPTKTEKSRPNPTQPNPTHGQLWCAVAIQPYVIDHTPCHYMSARNLPISTAPMFPYLLTFALPHTMLIGNSGISKNTDFALKLWSKLWISESFARNVDCRKCCQLSSISPVYLTERPPLCATRCGLTQRSSRASETNETKVSIQIARSELIEKEVRTTQINSIQRLRISHTRVVSRVSLLKFNGNAV